MKPSQLLQLLLAAGTISSFVPSPSVLASSFGEREVNHSQFAVVAAPYRHGYNLLILEQIPGQRPCWKETGTSPTVIEPLFLEFDFTNACVRSADSNGYSIRFEGEDYGLDYLLNVVKRDGELHLVGTPRDSSKPELHIGKTNGLSSGSLKIQLNPEWRLMKRTYQGQTTEHIYLSNSLETKEQFVSQSVSSNETKHQQPVNNVYPQPVNYPTPQQPMGHVYPQPVSYPVPQQPVGNVYSQPVNYPIPQQPVNNVYPQPVNYPIPQQPVGNVYSQPVNYPVPQQPVGNVYSQPVNYPVPLHINYQRSE